MFRSILIMVLFFSAGAAAQEKHRLTGTIELNTGESFPFSLVFTESGGMLKGYSLTYASPDDTKATIEGTLDKRAKTLSFRETEIIYSHDRKTQAYMCLVDATLTYQVSNGRRIFSGRMKSAEADMTACTGGSVVFANEDQVRALFAERQQFDTVISMGRRPKDTPPPAPVQQQVAEAPAITEKITKGIEKGYDWHSDTVIIDVWDGGNVDGDRVTLLYNGKPWLSGYPLAKQKRQLRIPISRTGEDVIAIVADNEGADPPNTATMMLTDGSIHYSIEAYNNKGSQAIIKVKRVR